MSVLLLVLDDVDATRPWQAVATALETAGSFDAITIEDRSRLWTVWDDETLGLAAPAFAVTDQGLAAALTGLRAREPSAWALLPHGRHVLGSLGSYVLARLTRGLWHAIDQPAAERTGLWSEGWRLPDDLDLASTALPEVLPADAAAPKSDPSITHGFAAAIALR